MTKVDNRQKSNLGKRPFPTKPEVVLIDFMVDLEKSVKGNIHISTMVDNFVKFIKAYALQTSTAVTASRFVTIIVKFMVSLKKFTRIKIQLSKQIYLHN